MRLFVAVELPEPLRQSIAVAGTRRDGWPPASWVRAENLHLTLAFVGEVDEARIGGLEAALRRHAAGAAPFSARTAAAGAFPSQGALRVVWLGLEPTVDFAGLARLARAACAEAALPFDEKPFAPHLTLARCKPPWPAATRERLAKLAPRRPLELEIGAIAIVASELGPSGPRYTRQAEARLGAAA
jgi:2'-5' RNA ligase